MEKKASKAIIYTKNLYLLQLRDNNTNCYPGQRSFFGGQINDTETPRDGLKRELIEEINWAPDKGLFLYEWVNPEDNWIVSFYKIKFDGNFNDLFLNEGERMEWFTYKNIKKLKNINEHVIYHIKNALENVI